MTLKSWNIDKNHLWITLAGALFFIPFLGVVHLFDWDEINFAESAREMLVSGDYFRVMIDFKPFWEKPPFFFWLQALSMKVFGVNEFAARFPNALFGIITLNTLYFLGKKLHNKKFGWIWAVTYGGGLLPFFYFKSGIIDPVFNYFIFTSVYFLYKATLKNENRTKYALLAGTLNGLAVLTKGPVGLLLLLLSYGVILVLQKFRQLPSVKDILSFAGAFVVITFLWYGGELVQNGPWFMVEFINYQIDLFLNPVAGHQQPLYYHFVVVFLGCFPFSIFALPAFSAKFDFADTYRIWMKSLFWVVMILFTIVTTKIVHYSSMAYLPLSYLAASVLYNRWQEGGFGRGLRIAFLIVGIVVSLLFTALPLVMIFKEKVIPFIKDDFVVASMQVEVPMGGWEWLIGLAYFFIVLYSFFYLKMNTGRAFWRINIGTATFLWLVMAIMVPRVERYSQGPEIDFFKSLQGKDVYVKNIGFKSYAQYFYFRQPHLENPQRHDSEWLLQGDIDKPVYFITKSTYHKLDGLEQLEFIGQKGGFKMYKRQ